MVAGKAPVDASATLSRNPSARGFRHGIAVVLELRRLAGEYAVSPGTAHIETVLTQPAQSNQPQALSSDLPSKWDGGDAMKKLFLILVASFALATARDLDRAYAGDGDGGGGIPLSKLAGKWAQSAQGSFTVCFKPDFSATENCSASGAVPVSGNFVQISQNTQDKEGNSCSTFTSTIGLFGTLPPFVSVGHSVTKVTSYDSVSASGDDSYIDYEGGKCKGAKFDGAGATLTSSGTDHFVASQNGERLDFVTTMVTDPVGDIGAFNSPAIALKQK